MASATPVYLLKTRASPSDAYEKLLKDFHDDIHLDTFEPIFVPVMEHQMREEGTSFLKRLLKLGSINIKPNATYGGLIFTSQRATEAFASVIRECQGAGHVL